MALGISDSGIESEIDVVTLGQIRLWRVTPPDSGTPSLLEFLRRATSAWR